MSGNDQDGSGAGLSVAIVGSGFGGLAAAIELKRNGFTDFVVFERADSVGGVWRDNHYPGAACDVPSVIYSFSYALKPDWSSLFGKQGEIKKYLERVAQEFDIYRHIRFGTEVTAAVFDETAGRWQVELGTGEMVVVDAVVMATGQLSRPKMPNVEGLGAFRGESFHSAEWDPAVDLTDKKVIVVGSGASAIQIVPAIAGQVSQLSVIQRSPNWVIRKSKRVHGPIARAALTWLPFLRRLHHDVMFLAYDLRWPLVSRKAKPLRVASEWWYKRVIRKHLRDPDAVRAATPDYTMLCNRLLLSNDWYPTLAKDHVRLIGSAVTRVVEDGVVTADGQHVRGDVIVWCTGFKASEFLAPIRIIGRGDADLHELWHHGAEAYLGISVSGFPNMFMMFGPNTNSITNSIVFLLERQAEYIRRSLQKVVEAGGGWFDLWPDEQQRFQTWLQDRLGETVFTDTCPGWYTNAEGKVTAMWPLSHTAYARMTRRFDISKHEYGCARAVGGESVAGAAGAAAPSPGGVDATRQ
ncbi:NAD(P)/FAD-dependent oxidoreductase [Nocardia nova]|uniref:flavin-containing monooxygenase n=1 Tax=Nocardia nova TaxID=37330 RepID=UPI0025AF2645|nr:NAD(P)/FAD-dependent oxidoreductase [Nocardia nova]MDN2495468.1 NAD(P)/FAD-dependent oxidoreductase [Nocardia nova]